MKRVLALFLYSLSILAISSVAFAHAGGEGGGATAPGEGGAADGADAGDGGPPDAGPSPKEYDLLENDGGRACSLGGPGGKDGLFVALAAVAVAVVVRRRARSA